MCVRARASLQTGRWVHDTGYWSSGEPYDGRIRGWGHRLVESGHRVVSIGKLHFRSSEDDNGFGSAAGHRQVPGTRPAHSASSVACER